MSDTSALYERADRALSPFVGSVAGGVVFAAGSLGGWRGYMLKGEDFTLGNTTLLTLMPMMLAGNLALQRQRGHDAEKFCTSSDCGLTPEILAQLLASGRLLADAFDRSVLLLAYAVPPFFRASVTVNRGGMPLTEFITFVQQMEEARKELWAKINGPCVPISDCLRHAKLL